MALKGDLASVELAQVFQMLALNKKVGLLSIQSPQQWRILYFDHRGVTLYYNEHVLLDRAAVTLVRAGRLMPESLAEARSAAMKGQASLPDTLLAGGYLTAADLEDACRLQVEEEIYDLFFCREARFEFLEGQSSLEGREGVVDERFFANTDSVIMEAARRIDEWAYLSERIGGAEDVFRTVGQPDPNQVDGDSLAILDLVDGRRNVARIAEVSALGTFPIYKHLCQLLDAGVIGPVADEELLAGAAECFRTGRLPDAISLFERAAALGVGVPDVYSQAAEALQAAERFEQASNHLKCDAEFRLAAGDVAGAVQRLHRAAAMLPTDLATRERLVELCLSRSGRVEGFDALAEGKTLVDVYFEAGDLRRARALLEKLLRLQPDDVDLKKALVNIHTRNGDTAKVIEMYESIAEDLVRDRRPIEAVGFLQKILMLDRSRNDVTERMRELYEFDESARTRRRCLAVLGGVFLLLAGLGVAYWFYDQRAQVEFDQLDVTAHLQAKDYPQAVAAMRKFIQDHPLTRAVSRAEEELARIEAGQKKHEAQMAHERAVRERELARMRGEYRTAWARHRELFLAGDPDGSLAALEKVRQLVRDTGEQDDLAWAMEEQVEKTWSRLRDFLIGAERLAGEAAQLIEAGDWDRARAVTLELTSKFDITRAAREARIPVQIRTRPKGARVMQGGRQVERSIGGVLTPLVTPAVVLCRPGEESLAVELEGFEAAAFVVDARRQAEVDLVLKVVAERTIRFPATVQTGIGTGGAWLVAGLRDGRVGIARSDTGKVVHVAPLGGLKAVDSTPVVSGGRAWFLSNEGTIECVMLEQGVLAANWPVRLDRGASTELVAGDGRLVLCDRDNRVICLDQADGRLLWVVPMEGQPAGRPALDRRTVVQTTTDGRVFVIDVVNGRLLHLWRCPAGITTRALMADGTLFFACSDGAVRAVDEDDGQVLWSKRIGRVLAEGELVVAGNGVVAVGPENRLLLLARTTGEERAAAILSGAAQRGLFAVGDRLFVPVRLPKDRNRGPIDLLQARDVADLSPLWEYQEQGTFTGPPGAGGRGVVLADANGEVALFR